MEVDLIVPLSEAFSLTSELGIGIIRLKNHADFSNLAVEELLAPIFDGALYNWDTNASVTRASLGLRYEKDHNKFKIKGSGHFSDSYIDSFGESTRFAGFSDHAGTPTFKLDVRHPPNMELRKYPLYLIGHLGNTTSTGSNRNKLGFDYFNEAGISIGV
ncbi:MAG: hypothetical protein ACJA09_004015 [Alcanivorax sp.]